MTPREAIKKAQYLADKFRLLAYVVVERDGVAKEYYPYLENDPILDTYPDRAIVDCVEPCE